MVSDLFLREAVDVEQFRVEDFLAIHIRVMENLILVVPVDSSPKLFDVEFEIKLALVIGSTRP